MAKHRFRIAQRTQVTAFLVVAVLGGWGQGLPLVRAGQQPARGALQNARKLQESLPKKDSAPPADHVTAPAVRPPDQGPKEMAAQGTEVDAMPLADLGAGKRDPFKLPPPPGTAAKAEESILEAAGPMPAGNRGLIISQVRLEGIVRQDVSNKMLAVVTNEARRAYFLTENEGVYNGVVSKITPDAVFFKENVLDRQGKVTTREVIKRLNSAPGEGR